MKKIAYISLILGVVGMACLNDPAFGNLFSEKNASCRELSVLYGREIRSLDSFLVVYPRYFPDSSWAVRQEKYKELAFKIKTISGFLTYFEPETYYSGITGPFHFVSPSTSGKGIFRNIPDNFILTGPLSIGWTEQELREAKQEEITEELGFIRKASQNFRKVLAHFYYQSHFDRMTESDLYDALRKEIIRITVVDVANADFIVDTAALPALEGSVDSWIQNVDIVLKHVLAHSTGITDRWKTLSDGALSYLEEHQDFSSFNRMVFTRNYLIPLSVFLYDLQCFSGVPFKKETGAVRSDARHIYDREVFNADFFAAGSQSHWSAEKEELGKILFFDPLLSGNNKRSCASCHKPEMAFSDGRVRGLGFTLKSLTRNTPTVINAGFQKEQLWDMRSASLEAQMDTVLNTDDELHENFGNLVRKLMASPEYVRRFKKAFPEPGNGKITREGIKAAIAVYQRTLTAMNSSFDQYMQGKENAMSPSAIRGFTVYMGKAKCGVCHFAPLFNGALPPFFSYTDHHSTGVPLADTMTKFRLGTDKGVFIHTGNILDQFSFKTPGLRNIELTAPYMHNGIFSSLDRVIDFYNEGGGAHFREDLRVELKAAGLPPIPLTLLPAPLGLTKQEKTDLIDFLKSLTDTSSVHKVPDHLPKLSGSYGRLNSRKPGGEY